MRFKKEKRIVNPTEGKMALAYQDGRIFTVTDGRNGNIVGMTYWEITTDNTLYFGPFAVSPAFQGRKIGKRMLAEVERIAREQRVEAIDIKVINLRTDLIAWYSSLGYEEMGTSPYPPEAAYKLTQPVHFVDMRRMLQYEACDVVMLFEVLIARLDDAPEVMK
jgi:ribosomal protein S18 acetylase RimI-like enzyme